MTSPRIKFPWSLPLFLLLGACAAPTSGPTGAPRSEASVSAPLALTPDGRTLWVVNPDADSVTPLDTRTLQAGQPVPVGDEPWAVAVTPNGTVVVANRASGTLSVLTGLHQTTIHVGPEPGGVALSPSGRDAYVSVSGSGEVVRVDLQNARVTGRTRVGPLPWAVAVTNDADTRDDDEQVIVTHRLARLQPGGEEGTDHGKQGAVTILQTATLARGAEVTLAPYAFGFPNTLEGVAVRGRQAWVAHQLHAPDFPRTFETTVAGAVSALDLDARAEVPARHLDLSDADLVTPTNYPRAVTVTPDGRFVLVALAGSDAVASFDVSEPERPVLVGFWPTGSNPRGVVVDASGGRAYVMNHLSRDVSVLDLHDRVKRAEVARVRVAPETLAPEVLRGAVLFNNASDPRLSHLGWVSCASCHPDGGADGTTWQGPDGPRQTQPLWRTGDTGPLHASATRDEVQDFEEDIETLMNGVGLAPGAFTAPLGTPSAGTSVDLDALAAYVQRGIRTPRAAVEDADAVARGRAVFSAAGCAACHGGSRWTSSRLDGPPGTLAPDGSLEVPGVLRDVGTFDAARDVLGENGFDVPSLLGVGTSAPYLHGGTAQDLAQVLLNDRHAPASLSAEERSDLVEFLKSIDETTEPFVP